MQSHLQDLPHSAFLKSLQRGCEPHGHLAQEGLLTGDRQYPRQWDLLRSLIYMLPSTDAELSVDTWHSTLVRTTIPSYLGGWGGMIAWVQEFWAAMCYAYLVSTQSSASIWIVGLTLLSLHCLQPALGIINKAVSSSLLCSPELG